MTITTVMILHPHIHAAILAMSLCVATAANAQLVFIPDVELRAWFNATVPGCVDVDGYLDTSLPALAEVDTVDLFVTWSPWDLTGFEQLTGLDLLTINFMWPQGTINAWPPNLTWLQFEGYGGTTLPTLPANLRECALYDVPLTELPGLPGTLERLQVGRIDAASIGPFPDGMEALHLEGIWPQLTEIVSLPPSLLTFQLLGYADSVNIQCLPQLPDGLELLYNDILLGVLPLCTPNIPTNPNFVIIGQPVPVCEVGSDCALTTSLVEQGAGVSSIWPNPVQDVINVERGSDGAFRSEILDATGRAMKQASDNGRVARIPVADLKSGIYALRLSDANGERVVRFVKE